MKHAYLTILLLRAFGQIEWPWSVVLAPVWITPIVFLALYVFCQVGGVLTGRYV